MNKEKLIDNINAAFAAYGEEPNTLMSNPIKFVHFRGRDYLTRGDEAVDISDKPIASLLDAFNALAEKS